MKCIFFVVFFCIYSVSGLAGMHVIDDCTVTSSQDDVKRRIHKASDLFYYPLLLRLLPNYESIENEIEAKHKMIYDISLKPTKDLTLEDIEKLEVVEAFVKENEMAEYREKYTQKVVQFELDYKKKNRKTLGPDTVSLEDLKGY